MLAVKFITPLEVIFHPCPPAGVDPTRCFEISSPFEVHVDRNRVIIPVGFYTDFASIPALFRGLISPTGRWGRAAVLHDFLYFLGYRNSRRLCDDIMLAGMVADGVGWISRQVIYRAVRLGGGQAWRGYRCNNYRYTARYNLNTLREGEPLLTLTVDNWRGPAVC